jgi:ElaB/YqjD/DUF883 family membrane-anchored ribosome-binding protein
MAGQRRTEEVEPLTYIVNKTLDQSLIALAELHLGGALDDTGRSREDEVSAGLQVVKAGVEGGMNEVFRVRGLTPPGGRWTLEASQGLGKPQLLQMFTDRVNITLAENEEARRKAAAARAQEEKAVREKAEQGLRDYQQHVSGVPGSRRVPTVYPAPQILWRTLDTVGNSTPFKVVAIGGTVVTVLTLGGWYAFNVVANTVTGVQSAVNESGTLGVIASSPVREILCVGFGIEEAKVGVLWKSVRGIWRWGRGSEQTK